MSKNAKPTPSATTATPATTEAPAAAAPAATFPATIPTPASPPAAAATLHHFMLDRESAPHFEGGVKYVAGDVIESPLDLARLFPEKWRRVVNGKFADEELATIPPPKVRRTDLADLTEEPAAT